VSVDAVSALVERRSLSVALEIVHLAQTSLAGLGSAPTDDQARLALNEAIVAALDGLLSDLAEHGAANVGSSALTLDLVALVHDAASAWSEVKRLRDSGHSSAPLTKPFMRGWLDPIGSPDWLANQRRAVAHRRDPTWVMRGAERLREPSG
jgi:hypothetical protein